MHILGELKVLMLGEVSEGLVGVVGVMAPHTPALRGGVEGGGARSLWGEKGDQIWGS